ncbi:hypothetical protein MSAS_35040 [Mycobacterium saskatchewanense]|nr:hypothetical protein MSAS_35040 [Mycobacterium saskatchewanense]
MPDRGPFGCCRERVAAPYGGEMARNNRRVGGRQAGPPGIGCPDSAEPAGAKFIPWYRACNDDYIPPATPLGAFGR